MLRSGTILMIREKAESGKSAYAIGKKLRISKNTAHKYIERRGDAPVKIDRFSKLDAYKPQLDELMNQGIFNCVVLLERLQRAGYSGGISILKEYVHPYRPAKALPAVRRYEIPAGKQTQMDWGICHYTDSSGTLHKVPAFVMILGKSRVKYTEFTSRCDLSSLERCIVNAFSYFGGVRYGVPWQYSGKEVRVRLCAGSLEIYYGEVLLAKHKAQYRSGNVVFLRGQYSGLAERNGVPVPFPCARKQDGAVEVRELSVYDQLLGGASCG